AWEEAGSPDAAQRANTLYKKLLEAYEPPPLDAAVADELEAFVARRKNEMGQKTP
ncbi:MAG: trimethylamine methyltransferase family protein, partial [Alphaproteobacteria bacterium]